MSERGALVVDGVGQDGLGGAHDHIELQRGDSGRRGDLGLLGRPGLEGEALDIDEALCGLLIERVVVVIRSETLVVEGGRALAADDPL